MAFEYFTDAHALAILGSTDTSGDADESLDLAAADLRAFVESVFTPGVLGQDMFKVSSDGDLDITVGSGSVGDRAVVAGTADKQYSYLAVNHGGPLSASLAAANVSNPRIDRIDLEVADDLTGITTGSTIRIPRVVVTSGTPSSNPEVPDAPTSSTALLPLAEVLVAAGATSIDGGDITDLRVAAGLVDGNPVGTIRMTGQIDPDLGWLLCDGSAVSRTTYARLFAAIGERFGAGNGSSTFNLPAFHGAGGRFPYAANTVGNTGQSGGDSSHVHAMPEHDHAVGPAQIIAAGGEGYASGTRHHYHGSTTDAGGGDTESASHIPQFVAVAFQIRY